MEGLGILIIIIFVVVISLILLKCIKPKQQSTTEENEHKSQPKKVEAKPKQREPLTKAEKEAIRQAREVFDWETESAIKKGEYNGKLPEHVVGEKWTELYPGTYNTYIAGINKRRGIRGHEWRVFDAMLIAEPKNKFDPNAIKIVSVEDKIHIGYIPADETEYVRAFVEGNLPHPCRVYIMEDEEENDETGRIRHFFRGRISIKK